MNTAILQNGRLIDHRHISNIDYKKRYSAKEIARIFNCSVFTIYSIIDRQNAQRKTDERHTQDITLKNYHTSKLSEILNVHRDIIYKFRMTGELEQSPLYKTIRIPSWSVIDFINRHSYCNNQLTFHFISFPKNIIRIPGWSLADYITSKCSEL
ncbi:MAG: hypothetical protein ACE5I1_31840 [bacterium]